MLRQGKSSAAAVPLAPAGSCRDDARQDKKATAWRRTPDGVAPAVPVRARAHQVRLADAHSSHGSRHRQTAPLPWGSKETKEAQVGCRLRPASPTAARGTHESAHQHPRYCAYRGMPRQNLSCPDRFRLDNEKTPTTHRVVFSRIFSSSFQRWPSGDTHQTSRVPSSVTRVSSRTGTIFPSWPSSLRVTCKG